LNFALLYDELPLVKIIDRFDQTLEGRYIILNSTGELIFDSYSTYTNLNVPIEDILNGKEVITNNDKTYYVQAITKTNGGYSAVHIVSQDEIGGSQNAQYIFIIFGILTIISLFMYTISAYTVSSKVNMVIHGMEKLGSNNLSYRIPVNMKSRNEFTTISKKLNEMGGQLEDMIHREYITELNKKNAELAALQSWINPHFLYNTLEMIRLKSLEDGNQEVSDMIVLLAKLFRNIAKSEKYISIFEETNTCNMYLDLLSHRYNYNFMYEMNINPETLQYGIPKNVLQPIIENYFVHGMKKDKNENELNITAKMENGNIVFIFEDNGRGMRDEELSTLRYRLGSYEEFQETKYGLLNIQKRIKLIYGKHYGISIDSNYNKGTKIVLKIKALSCEKIEIITEENKNS
jgi:two-component system sensor histidine kinase YesM